MPIVKDKPMFIEAKPLRRQAIVGLFCALSTKSWGPVAFSLLALVMAATYLYAWNNTPRRPAS